MTRRLSLLLFALTFTACGGGSPSASVDADTERLNTAPTAPTVSIAPTNPITQDDLTVTFLAESTDPDGDTVTYEYRWFKDSVPQTDLTTDTVPAAATAKGEVWQVVVTPNDGEADGIAGQAERAIGNTAPTVTLVFDPASPKTTDDLAAVVTATDEDEDTVSLTFSWTRDGMATAFVTDTVPSSETESGQRWSVTVTPSDGDDAGEGVTQDITIANSPPVLEGVAITPDPATASDELTATPGSTTDADGDEVSLGYTWTIDEAVVEGRNTATLPAGTAEKGQRVQVRVTPRDDIDDGETVTSNIITIDNTPPRITSVAIMPAAGTESTTFTCSPEGWDDLDNDTEGYNYQWYVNGNAISVTAQTLTGTDFDKGDIINCEAAPFDGTATGPALPSSTVTIENTPPTVASVVISPATPTKSDTITVSTAGWSDADGDTEGYLYEWRIGGSVVGSGTSLTGSAFNRGDVIRVIVTPFDGEVPGTPVTSNSVTVVNTPPSITGVTLSPDPADTTSNLTASPAGWSDPDPGDNPSYIFAWYRNGTLINGVSGAVLSSANFGRGDGIYVTATPTDGTVAGNLVASNSVTITNSLPTSPTVTITPPNPNTSDDLTCAGTGSTDADNDPVTYSYSWSDGIVNRPGSVLAASATSDGETWVCTVTPSDGTANGPAATASANIGVRTDCAAILAANPGSPDGVYWIDPDGLASTSNPAFQAYCDMTTSGGGWTMTYMVTAPYFEGRSINNSTLVSSAPTAWDQQFDLWNVRSTISVDEMIVGCTTQNDATSHHWVFGDDDIHRYWDDTATSYGYFGEASVSSNSAQILRGAAIRTNQFGAIHQAWLCNTATGPLDCDSARNIIWGGGQTQESTTVQQSAICATDCTTRGFHISPIDGFYEVYPICNGVQTSNGRFWIGVR